MLKKAHVLILLSVFLVGCNNTEENTKKKKTAVNKKVLEKKIAIHKITLKRKN
ncbi:MULTISPECIES: hypothetical protein [Staphylococcus]|uniref:hypothetical protein n=1 Tax=Staphylococcus TaxID=1279 RepID=UPI0015FB860D|nr:hypothetical protein [Staphylococcus gallinarum]